MVLGLELVPLCSLFAIVMLLNGFGGRPAVYLSRGVFLLGFKSGNCVILPPRELLPPTDSFSEKLVELF